MLPLPVYSVVFALLAIAWLWFIRRRGLDPSRLLTQAIRLGLLVAATGALAASWQLRPMFTTLAMTGPDGLATVLPVTGSGLSAMLAGLIGCMALTALGMWLAATAPRQAPDGAPRPRRSGLPAVGTAAAVAATMLVVDATARATVSSTARLVTMSTVAEPPGVPPPVWLATVPVEALQRQLDVAVWGGLVLCGGLLLTAIIQIRSGFSRTGETLSAGPVAALAVVLLGLAALYGWHVSTALRWLGAWRSLLSV